MLREKSGPDKKDVRRGPAGAKAQIFFGPQRHDQSRALIQNSVLLQTLNPFRGWKIAYTQAKEAAEKVAASGRSRPSAAKAGFTSEQGCTG
jgi:hypothetical protein